MNTMYFESLYKEKFEPSDSIPNDSISSPLCLSDFTQSPFSTESFHYIDTPSYSSSFVSLSPHIQNYPLVYSPSIEQKRLNIISLASTNSSYSPNPILPESEYETQYSSILPSIQSSDRSTSTLPEHPILFEHSSIIYHRNNEICAICHDGHWLSNNRIIFCDQCSLGYHQKCFGIENVPEGKWFCSKDCSEHRTIRLRIPTKVKYLFSSNHCGNEFWKKIDEEYFTNTDKFTSLLSNDLLQCILIDDSFWSSPPLGRHYLQIWNEEDQLLQNTPRYQRFIRFQNLKRHNLNYTIPVEKKQNGKKSISSKFDPRDKNLQKPSNSSPLLHSMISGSKFHNYNCCFCASLLFSLTNHDSNINISNSPTSDFVFPDFQSFPFFTLRFHQNTTSTTSSYFSSYSLPQIYDSITNSYSPISPFVSKSTNLTINLSEIIDLSESIENSQNDFFLQELSVLQNTYSHLVQMNNYRRQIILERIKDYLLKKAEDKEQLKKDKETLTSYQNYLQSLQRKQKMTKNKIKISKKHSSSLSNPSLSRTPILYAEKIQKKQRALENKEKRIEKACLFVINSMIKKLQTCETNPPKYKNSNFSETKSVALYCICQQPYNNLLFYIGCDMCDNWFHGHCVNITAQQAQLLNYYICPLCQYKNQKKDLSSLIDWNQLRYIMPFLTDNFKNYQKSLSTYSSFKALQYHYPQPDLPFHLYSMRYSHLDLDDFSHLPPSRFIQKGRPSKSKSSHKVLKYRQVIFKLDGIQKCCLEYKPLKKSVHKKKKYSLTTIENYIIHLKKIKHKKRNKKHVIPLSSPYDLHFNQTFHSETDSNKDNVQRDLSHSFSLSPQTTSIKYPNLFNTFDDFDISDWLKEKIF